MTNITITKGALSVTIQSVEVTEDYANQIKIIPFAQTKQKQNIGPNTPKAMDLLLIRHTLVLRGHISKTSSKTAKEIKDDLKTIFRGANTTGGPCVVAYDENNYNMYIEKLMIIEKSNYKNTDTQGVIKYDVQVTLVEGE